MSKSSARRPLALLAVLGMVAALLFAVTGTASSGVGPSHPAKFSACPDNADIPDGGFSDVPVGSFFNDSVSCLAYYHVTTGVTPTTYGPAAEVTRAQMALFLARGAAAAGVILTASPPDAGFTDIGGLSAEAQLAINQLADAGIVKGKTTTTYEPGSTVWRQHMALFLTRYWDVSTIGPGGSFTAFYSGAPFTDIGATTVEANQAINAAWDLGIATGTSATTYDPLGNVNRGQMALFLTRMYAHTNTRPAGVNIQANPTVVEGAITVALAAETEYSVTVRNADFSPKPNTHVDAFLYRADEATDTPFDSAGKCDLSDPDLALLSPPGATPECTLTVTDQISDIDGNFIVTPLFFFFHDAFTTFYAWTDAIGAEFDVDTTTYSAVTIEGVVAPPEPDHVTLAFSVNGVPIEPCPCGFTVHSGDAVTWTAQLVDSDGDPVPWAEVDVTFNDQWNDGSSSGTSTTVVKTDSSGASAYPKTQILAMGAPDFLRTVRAETVAYGNTGSTTAVWSDDASEPITIKLVTTKYKVIAAAPDTTPNSVTATVYDQYGDVYVDADQVKFSGHPDGLMPPVTLNLVDGRATADYVWVAGAGTAMETLEAELVSNPLVDESALFYWVQEGVPGTFYAPNPSVIVHDEANMSIVSWVPLDGYRLLHWTAVDRFIVNGAGATAVEFEAAILTPGVAFTVEYVDPADGNKSSWTVTVP